MIKNAWLFLLLLCSYTAFAQYTDVINSSRPGFAETPYAIGTGVTQLEAGFQYGSSDIFSQNTILKSNLFNQTLRFGLISEKLEFNLQFSQDINKLIFKSTNDFGTSVRGTMGAGVKYLLLDAKVKNRDHEIRSWKKRTGFHWSMVVPSIAINASASAGMKPSLKESANITLEDPLSSLDIAKIRASLNPNANVKVGVLLQNHIKESWVIASNFSYERRFFNDFNDTNIYNIIVAGTFSPNRNWSFFAESKNTFNIYQNNFDLRTGAVYLINKNLQVDASIHGNIGTNFNSSGVSVGFSWRLDEHIDKPIKVKKVSIDSIQGPSFLKRAGQNTKEFFIVAGISIGTFFSNVGTDISIFTQNLFLSKENHLEKRERTPKKEKPIIVEEEKEEPLPEPKKPTRGRLLNRETEDYKSGKTFEEERKKQEKLLAKENKAKEKAEKERLAEEKKARKAAEKEEKERLKAEKRDLKEMEKEEKLYLEAEAQAQKEEEKRLANEKAAADEKRIAEEKEAAAVAAALAMKNKKAEQERIAAEKKAEEARKAEETRNTELARKAEEKRLAEEKEAAAVAAALH